MNLTATPRMVGDVIVAHCQGQIIYGDEVEELSKKISSQVHSRDRQLVLHLGGLEELRRGDLGTLWLCYMAALAVGWRIRFCNLTEDLRNLLQTTGLAGVFEIYDSEEQAVASFGKLIRATPSLHGDASLVTVS
jgi:anti-sigma B factor antagonist